MHVSIVFLVRVQCRRKESSRSLSHLLMSFLYKVANRCFIVVGLQTTVAIATVPLPHYINALNNVEMLGPLADEAQLFLAAIGRKASLCTADQREATFLYQRISVAIQRFNAVCMANSLTVSESPS